MNTKELLENISNDCLTQITKYKYNKNLDMSDKYRKGSITALEYTLDLIYHFYEKDKKLKTEFETILTSQIEYIQSINDSEYKEGLIEALTWTKQRLNNQ